MCVCSRLAGHEREREREASGRLLFFSYTCLKTARGQIWQLYARDLQIIAFSMWHCLFYTKKNNNNSSGTSQLPKSSLLNLTVICPVAKSRRSSISSSSTEGEREGRISRAVVPHTQTHTYRARVRSKLLCST